MAHTACLVCLISTVSGRSKKSQNCGASSGHITKLKQSIYKIYMAGIDKTAHEHLTNIILPGVFYPNISLKFCNETPNFN